MAAYLIWRRPAQHPGEQTDPATAEQEELPPPPDPWERTQQATPGRPSSSSLPLTQQTELPVSNERGSYPPSLKDRWGIFLLPFDLMWLLSVCVRTNWYI